MAGLEQDRPQLGRVLFFPRNQSNPIQIPS